jgi:hypothetical protein
MGVTVHKEKWKAKGQYIICVEEEDNGKLSVYSTDSIFWRDFFK